MSDLTPEQERKIALAFLGKENFQKFETSQILKTSFKPEKSKPEPKAETVFRKKAAEAYPYIDLVFGERWRVNIWNGSKFVRWKDNLTFYQADTIRYRLQARGYQVNWAMVERGRMIAKRLKTEKQKNRQAPSRKQSIISRIGKLKY